MAENRLQREFETRDQNSRSKSWQPSSLLPEVAERKGWAHRWIRTSFIGKVDNVNVSSAFREGWEPVKVEDYPELHVRSDRNSEFTGNIEIGGLLLCKRPEEVSIQRAAHYANKSAEQMAAVDSNLMKQNDPRMPLFKESRTSVSFGSGKK